MYTTVYIITEAYGEDAPVLYCLYGRMPEGEERIMK